MFSATVSAKKALRIFEELISQGVYFAARPNPTNPDEVLVVVEDTDGELVAPFLLSDKK